MIAESNIFEVNNKTPQDMLWHCSGAFTGNFERVKFNIQHTNLILLF